MKTLVCGRRRRCEEVTATPTAGTDPRRNLTMLTGERPGHRESPQPTPDGHYVRQPLNQTEGDSDIDIMDRPPLIVSQEAEKAWRLSIKHRMEDQARGAQGDASKSTAPPSQQRPEVVRRLATPVEQTQVARSGQPGRAFMDSGNRADTIWSPGGSATTAAIGLTKMMTLPKKSESPRITTWSLSEVKLFAEWCDTSSVPAR